MSFHFSSVVILSVKNITITYKVCWQIIFVALGHRQKFIYVKNKHVKYSHDLIWGTYGTYIHTYIHTHTHTYIHTYHTYIHTYTHIHTDIHSIHTYTHTHKHTQCIPLTCGRCLTCRAELVLLAFHIRLSHAGRLLELFLCKNYHATILYNIFSNYKMTLPVQVL